MWVWVVVAVASILGILALSLCIPIHALLNYDTAAKPKFRVRLVWLFGLVGTDMAPSPARTEKKHRAPTPSRKDAWRIASTPGLLSEGKKLIKDTFSTIRVREMSIKLQIGFADPADAGMLSGILSAAKAAVRLPKEYKIDLLPTISDQFTCDGNIRCGLSVRPIRLIPPASRFAISRPGRRLMRLAILRR